MENMKWYVLRVLSGHERKVKDYLEKEIDKSDLKNYIKKILVPLEKTFQMRKEKRIFVDKVLYPGYIFVQADLTTGEVVPRIKEIPGVSAFVGPKGSAPTPMSDEEVRNLLRTVDEFTETAETFSTDFYKGDSVKIAYGPFNGFSGIIDVVNKEKRTVKVNVKIFGRDTPVELAIEHVEKI
jgi:transcriptional antiterminator NusG